MIPSYRADHDGLSFSRLQLDLVSRGYTHREERGLDGQLYHQLSFTNFSVRLAHSEAVHNFKDKFEKPRESK